LATSEKSCIRADRETTKVATDLRLYLREAIDGINAELTRLQTGIVELADQHASTVMPGFTHLQVAQPVTFGHHLLAWNEMLERDYSRLTGLPQAIERLAAWGRRAGGNHFPYRP
jgi:argininosuccinate lyase